MIEDQRAEEDKGTLRDWVNAKVGKWPEFEI